jgi:hypothetical protein
MNKDDFEELVRAIIKPSLSEVMSEFKAQLNPNYLGETLAFKAIRSEYEKALKEFKTGMVKKSKAVLDSHKESACLCCAIVKSRVLDKCEWGPIGEDDPYANAYKYPNELLAVTAAMRIIKKSLLADLKFANNNDIRQIIASSVPYYPGNVTDKFSYLSNTIFYIGRFSSRHISGARLFDTGAYSTIFYHLDRENRAHVLHKYEQLKKAA